MSEVEQKLVDIKFILDMYNARADTSESTLDKIQKVLSPETKLNNNQKVVFEWLKKQYHEPADWQFPLFILKNAITDMPGNVFAFYNDLNEKEEFEIVMEFAQWGLEQEESSNEI